MTQDVLAFPHLQMLNRAQCDAIHHASLEILRRTGVRVYHQEALDLLRQTDAAIADGNLEDVAAAAHALKSPVSNLGGRRLADLLERCEVAAREGADITAVRRSAAGLKAHYAALVAALQNETRRGTGTG